MQSRFFNYVELCDNYSLNSLQLSLIYSLNIKEKIVYLILGHSDTRYDIVPHKYQLTLLSSAFKGAGEDKN